MNGAGLARPVHVMTVTTTAATFGQNSARRESRMQWAKDGRRRPIYDLSFPGDSRSLASPKKNSENEGFDYFATSGE